MTNPITGSGALGFGFDIFGVYGEDSILRPLINLGSANREWTSQAGETYDVLANTTVSPGSGAGGSAYVFDSRETFSSHFAVKAGIKGSYGAFTGEFEADFAIDTSSERSYIYGLYEEIIDSWSLTLVDWSRNALLPNVLQDPDFADLPSEYTTDNKYLFFRFFTKYGTHFTTRVSCGARMSYCVAVDESYTSNTSTVSTKLSAEFGGVFADASAHAEADFATAGEQWFSNRKVSVRTIGGNTDLVASIIPAYDVNNNAAFQSWITSADRWPSPTGFQVTPIASLFSGDQAAAVNAAYEAYANSRLYAEARTDGCAILLSGRPLIPSSSAPTMPTGSTPSSGDVPWPEMGWYAAVIDRTDLNVAFLKGYAPQGSGDSPDDIISACNTMWKQMYTDLHSYAGKTQYVFALTSRNWWGPGFPVSEMVSFLEGCGAGTGLEEWRERWTTTGSTSGLIDYVLLGVIGIGPGAGIETFVHEPDSEKSAASAAGLLIPTAINDSPDQVQFDLVPA
jgi:hypothetical protein